MKRLVKGKEAPQPDGPKRAKRGPTQAFHGAEQGCEREMGAPLIMFATVRQVRSRRFLMLR